MNVGITLASDLGLMDTVTSADLYNVTNFGKSNLPQPCVVGASCLGSWKRLLCLSRFKQTGKDCP